MKQDTLFIGLDVHKETIAVAVAEGLRGSEVRFMGTIVNKPEAIVRLVTKQLADFAKTKRKGLPRKKAR